MFARPNRRRVALDCGDEQMTKQSHKDECDIHNILAQYQRTGIMTHINERQATYEDLPDQVDYQQALHTVMAAEAAFAELPSKVRDHFDNDPARFLAAFGDPTAADKLREFGLLNPLPEKPAEPTTEAA